MLTKRDLLLSGASLAGTAALGFGFGNEAASATLMRSDADWKRSLTAPQYAVLRQEGTERSGSSPLNAEKRAGTYRCAGCRRPVYSSATKFESGTGWPSFYASLPGAVGTKVDRKLSMARVEVHCGRCDGHLGHIFDDGPAPTGKRHCLNGVALSFAPSAG